VFAPAPANFGGSVRLAIPRGAEARRRWAPGSARAVSFPVPPGAAYPEAHMAKRHLLMLGLLLGGGALSSACEEKEIVTIGGDAGESGEAGDTGDNGGKQEPGTGGTSGSSNVAGKGGAGDAAGAGDGAGAGGIDGAAPAAGAGGTDGEPDYPFPASLNPQGVVVIGPTPATSTHLLVGASNYTTHKAEVVSITLGSGAVGTSTTFDDSDLLATSSAGIGFAIERTNDKLHRLDGGSIATTFDLKDPGRGATISNKAYVPFLNQSLIAILDLDTGKTARRIDLNEFNADGDGDHSADIAEGVYDPTSKVSYFLLQRIDRNSINAASNFNLPCAAARALIVGINSETDAIVDLNGSAAGKGIELKLVNPRSLSVNGDGTKLTLLADGCYEGINKIDRGVEVVNLIDHTSAIAYQAADKNYLASLILTGGGNALLESYDENYATHWNKLDIDGGTLGAELHGVPSAVSYDGTDLLGVQASAKVGKVVRYQIASETSTEISPTSWGGDYSSASATALVQ